MPPKHIAQTSTEVKKAYKKNGPVISERTHKQLQRGHELEQRATREREAEQRRKLAKERRSEREKKDEKIRKQIGVGLATQLIGYSHTQAHLKQGMEAFLGINKKQLEERRRKEEEQRREEEFAKKLEVIAQDTEKELFDDEDMDDVMLDLPVIDTQDGGGWVDDDLDDDTLLEVHDFVMSDPVEQTVHEPISAPPRPATAPPTPPRQTPRKSQQSTVPLPVQHLQLQSDLPQRADVKEDFEFTRAHGPINRIVEAALDRLPGDTIEFLSQDSAAAHANWEPANGLLYKLNPVGLPPHRLRVKIGCVVVCLRDLNTSSQLSKSQHVRILRAENERLECLTLDGQLAGTKTVITRVPFAAKYRNDDKFPFTRVQYPVRVATDYIQTEPSQEVQQSGFKLPSINGKARPPTLVRRPTPPTGKQLSSNPTFKLPGLPASKVHTPAVSESSQPIAPTSLVLDNWDDFLESGTQIARELSVEDSAGPTRSDSINRHLASKESTPPLSTQDFDFSLDDLDDEPPRRCLPITDPDSSKKSTPKAQPKAVVLSRTSKPPASVKPGPLSRTANLRRIDLEARHASPPIAHPQRPPQSKSKRPMAPHTRSPPLAKKPRLAPPPFPRSATTTTSTGRLSDFGISTQEATSFFDDDDEFAFGSPPIAV